MVEVGTSTVVGEYGFTVTVLYWEFASTVSAAVLKSTPYWPVRFGEKHTFVASGLADFLRASGFILHAPALFPKRIPTRSEKSDLFCVSWNFLSGKKAQPPTSPFQKLLFTQLAEALVFARTTSSIPPRPDSKVLLKFMSE